IEEAEEMADRIGVIRQGELILVEDKLTLMRKLGKKQLILQLTRPLTSLPETLMSYPLALAQDGSELIYTYDTREEATDITVFLQSLNDAGIAFRDLQTRESSLEEIFVNLVSEQTS